MIVLILAELPDDTVLLCHPGLCHICPRLSPPYGTIGRALSVRFASGSSLVAQKYMKIEE